MRTPPIPDLNEIINESLDDSYDNAYRYLKANPDLPLGSVGNIAAGYNYRHHPQSEVKKQPAFVTHTVRGETWKVLMNLHSGLTVKEIPKGEPLEEDVFEMKLIEDSAGYTMDQLLLLAGREIIERKSHVDEAAAVFSQYWKDRNPSE